MTSVEQKKNLKLFVKNWRGIGNEKQQTQQFWFQLLTALGYENINSVLFEHRVSNGGFVDVWIPDVDVMIEMKSYGIDLDKPEHRQGKLKTPLEQVCDYADDVPRGMQPRYVITCNFDTFRVYDRDKYGRSELKDNCFSFSLDELGSHPEYLNCIIDPANSRLEKEKQVSLEAGLLIGQLYNKLQEGYLDPESEQSMHALNVLCVRLVFCLYCEDADLFEKNSFYQYLNGVAPEDVRNRLQSLFKALDTEQSLRDPYDTRTKMFPYVNGGLFREDVEIPNFTQETLDFLLNEVSAPVDWSQISPTIFGGIFESTLNPETRRSGGMVFTSVGDIHKVIDPLFLDDLWSEFRAISDDYSLTPRQKDNRYKKFHKKLCELSFFDPACGSGNFLTETYLSLRKLEDAVLGKIRKKGLEGQMELTDSKAEESGERISLTQFHGIEINDFAVSVAETALYISRLKANADTMMLLDVDSGDLPLRESAHIVLGNALRMDWNDIVPADECDYIMGNPPFVGTNWLSDSQREDMDTIWHGTNRGKLDYVTCWFVKSAEYMDLSGKCRTALVSTNSITQGEQATTLWKKLLIEEGYHIDFAWKTFIWNNESSEQAHVHVVIIGFSKHETTRMLFGDGKLICDNINQYLLPAPTVIVEEHSKPLSEVQPIMRGSQATDNGLYLFSKEEKDEFLHNEPDALKWFKRFMMGKEFINDLERWCLWIPDITDEELNELPYIKERVKQVREFRLQSKNAQTKKSAQTPCRFGQYRPPTKTYVAFGKVSSQRRLYNPIGFLTDDVIPGDKLFTIPYATLYHFGVLQSQFHNAWLRTVGGRLKSDYSYSTTLVYNTFVWPSPSEEQKLRIENCAQAVLDARENHRGKSLATLYDPDKMPDDLLSAHLALDKAVENAYGIDCDRDEAQIVAHLFYLYQQMVSSKETDNPVKQTAPKETAKKATVKVKVKRNKAGMN